MFRDDDKFDHHAGSPPSVMAQRLNCQTWVAPFLGIFFLPPASKILESERKATTGMKNQTLVLAMILLFVSGLASAVAQPPTNSSPPAVVERIIVMRHAEKPDNPSDPNLTPAGFTRAQKLPAFIQAHYGRPDYIFAAANSKKSARPAETAAPLSQVSGVPIDSTFRDKDFAELASVLTGDNRFLGKLIVVVWHHGNIPELAHSLGAKEGSYPDEWDSSVYNQILQFDYTQQRRPIVTRVIEPF
jgi:phosphohistidine phosphatase SixA